MKLDYGTQLSPEPIKLSIGTLKKPTLKAIYRISFEKFNTYEYFLKMTPEKYCTDKKNVEWNKKWESMSEKERNAITLFDLIRVDEPLQETYCEVLNFFFVEKVIFKEDLFILIDESNGESAEITLDNICGVIHEKTLQQTLEVIQQVCCIYEEEESTDGVKFKNNAAKKIFEKILSAQKEKKEKKKADINMTLPNIISAVSNNHPSVTPMTVWDLTIFQLLDSFGRLQSRSIFQIDARRVSVWGDEKKTFDHALWYKNNYDVKKSDLF